MRSWLLLVGLSLSAVAAPSSPQSSGDASARQDAEKKEKEPRVGIRFKGLLPGSIDRKLEGRYEVEFKIYKSPQGGDAIWRETLDVKVTKGVMDVVLGAEEKNRIPMAIHEATFKWVGAAVNGQREIYPRFPIVNVVYVSPKEALIATAANEKDDEPAKDDPEYVATRFEVENATKNKVTWRKALEGARAAKGDLPDYETWYASLSECDEKTVLERAGHYEWVLPWVYDTASHGRFNRYFRGRFEGCDYMDLSPENEYPWRVARTVAKKPEQEDK